MVKRHLIRIASIAIAVVSLCAAAEGQMPVGDFESAFLQFEPNPPSPTLPEFIWTGPGGNFQTGPGCIGNGDGDLPLSAQTPGGLEVDTPIPLPNIPNSTIDATGTHFFDITLQLSSNAISTDLQDQGGGIEVPITFSPYAIQPLSNAKFDLYTTPANDSPAQQALGPILLLAGTLTNNSIGISSSAGNTSATFSSGSVTLIGGTLLDALNGGLPIPENWSIALNPTSLVTINADMKILPGISAATISRFSADATSLLPEPDSTALSSIAAIACLARPRQRLRRRAPK